MSHDELKTALSAIQDNTRAAREDAAATRRELGDLRRELHEQDRRIDRHSGKIRELEALRDLWEKQRNGESMSLADLRPALVDSLGRFGYYIAGIIIALLLSFQGKFREALDFFQTLGK